jgi:hypothetical protein
VIEEYLANLTRDVAPMIATGCIQSTKDNLEKEELRHMFDEFIDRSLMQCAVENLSRLYEDEEEQIHIREAAKKEERDKVKMKTDIAKMGM